VIGDLFADDLSPPTDHAADRQLGRPSAFRGQPAERVTDERRVPTVTAGS